MKKGHLILISLTVGLLSFGLGWWANEMSHFANGVIADGKRDDSLRRKAILANKPFPTLTVDDSSRKTFQPDSLTKITGDFNGDHIIDSAIVMGPYAYDASGWCSSCITTISFTHKIDELTIPYESVGAVIYNVGDLDGNKSDELLVIPDWFNSCWGSQIVYSYKNNRWDSLASDQIYRCNLYNRIRKVKNGVFEMIVHTGPGGSGQYSRRVTIKR